jgi:hypothetical protein
MSLRINIRERRWAGVQVRSLWLRHAVHARKNTPRLYPAGPSGDSPDGFRGAQQAIFACLLRRQGCSKPLERVSQSD